VSHLAIAEQSYGARHRNSNGQVFDSPKTRRPPQDEYGDGRSLSFRTGEHGGDEPDNMPQPIEVKDPEGRWAIYLPLTINGKIVVPRQTDERA
jgi:hypothetical protein